MDMSRFLVLCVLVAVAYANVKQSKRVPPSGPCDKIMEALHVNQLPAKFHRCGGADNGTCFDASFARCDSVVDCPNSFTDELDCKAKHLDDCNNGYTFKGTDEPFKCRAAGQDSDDRMCILYSWECDGKEDCPHGDDEENCQ